MPSPFQLSRGPLLRPFAIAALPAMVALAACGPGSGPSSASEPAFFAPAGIAADGVTFVAGDGRSFSCTVEVARWDLPSGSPVPLDVDNSMNFSGQTRPPLPTIFLNFASLDRAPVPGQIFIFVHECGHVNSESFLSEIEANCWATRRLSTQGVLSPQEWEVVHQMLVSAYPAPLGPYPSGEDQWTQMQRCR